MPDLAAALAPHLEHDARPRAAAGDRLAAVLALLVGDEPTLVFTERAAAMSRHAGEVSFPGGIQDPGDDELLETALRETQEELGIAPTLIDVIGALSPIHTFVSGILVTPFDDADQIAPDRLAPVVDRAIEAGVHVLVANGNTSEFFGLTMAEAMNDLAFIATGAYGAPLPKPMGAPIRLHLPWKYGFKSVKSIVRISFVDQRPVSFWEQLAGDEYGFWANVNPEVPHPRWSQASERIIGSNEQVPTMLYNGYGGFVAELYKGLEGEKLFMLL